MKLTSQGVNPLPRPSWSWNQFSPGIALRLGVAFAAVAVLALAANVLVDRGVRVVQRTFAAEPALPVAVPPGPVPPVSEAAPTVALPVEVAADPAALRQELAQFDLVLQSSLGGPDRALRAQLADARRRLSDAAAAFADAARAEPLLRNRLETAVAAYVGLADKQIAAAEARRRQLAEYRTTLDVLRSQAAGRLDQAWKVLGRVVARQYLVDYRDALDQLHDRAVRMEDADGSARAAVQELVTAEEQVGRRLAVVRTHRDETWVEQAQRDLHALTAAREQAALLAATLTRTQAQRPPLRAGLLASVEELAAVSQKQSVLPEVPAAPAAAADAGQPLTPIETAGALDNLPAAAADATASADPLPEQNTGSGDGVLLWLSASVLLLILFIAVTTVRSVAGQVRRLQIASRRIAAGESVHVPAGGIRELDLVAASFNEMSQVLLGARNIALRYQQDLEARVAERTRALSHQASHDPLTDLPNRRELFRFLEEVMAEAARSQQLVGLFVLDLDHFKDLNDSMGHGFGDRVLIGVASRLQEMASRVGGFAARLGGDEFTVVLPAAPDLASVRSVGWDLVRAFQLPVEVEGNEVLLGVSVGVSISPEHARAAEDLLRAADAALFRAKALGRSQVAVFTPELLEVVSARFSTEQGLRRAVERGEFELMFQPEVDTESFEVKSVEALLRWRLPDGNLVAPGDFLKVAEESGLITEISDWVLQDAIAAAARWHHGDWPEARVAINVSSRQVLNAGFLDRLGGLLAQHGLPPRCIEIELTETVLQTGIATIRALEGLRAMGIAVALDDFGTGYSSLTSLEQLPLSRVKLDRSLIEQLDSKPRALAIVDAIVRMCRGLDLEVTAEGIERAQQLPGLLSQGPLLLQGYLFSRPVPFSQIAALRQSLPQQSASWLLELRGGAAEIPVEPQSSNVTRLSGRLNTKP